MKNIKLVIEYDGTRYNGWQKQINTQNTIQGKLTDILSSICEEEIQLIGSGRTDAGVHAYNQVANFQTNTKLPLEVLKKTINEKLEKDICVKKIEAVDPRFHSRYNAESKKYLYRIWTKEDINVFERKYSYHISEKLDIEKMKKAAECFIGTYDFKGFTSDKRTKKSTVKTIYSIELTVNNGLLEILYHGDSFLYNMVRIITGTLIEIGLGKMQISQISEIFESKDRTKAGFTVPPHGLFLKDVLY